MARDAASLSSNGAGKSGYPCPRLMAPYESARRVISRMTDSVNEAAFTDIARRLSVVMRGECRRHVPSRHGRETGLVSGGVELDCGSGPATSPSSTRELPCARVGG